ncbi:Gfo/Idh/MocA family protein [Pelagibius sp. Alg239-R121]|uniref:Gfo/Idh/MocA family protein n=1 Tax=Pelagibius sp. Alg239-R121 TaxID=2993448 RepID=UPI0024A6C79A|nr:Gfo/Idh/MocA family oxidoreductase [Pelagibius sp. Alg239-R121]
MTSVRLALIGAGRIGVRHLETIAQVEEADLVAVADASPTVKGIAERYGVTFYDNYKAMLAEVKPDGVIVATPTELHLAPALAALENGAHVLIEKPITGTLGEAQILIEKSRATQREVLVGHHRRYYPFVHKAREIVRSGGLGQLVAVNGQWTLRKADSYFDQVWRQKREAGPILINLIHEFDCLRYVCGEITSLSAELASTVRGHEKEETAAIILRFENGALGTFLLSDSAASPWAWEFGFHENPEFPPAHQNASRFVGDSASLEFPNLKLWRHDDTARGWNTPLRSEDKSCTPEDAYINQCKHFCRVIQGEEAPRITAEDATRSLQATLAVFDAAESGQRITL